MSHVLAAHSKVPATGAAMLGFFIGYLVWYFVVRFGKDKYTSDGLVAVVGVIAGGVVVDLLKGGGLTAADRWWYPIGLVGGWLVFTVFNLLNWALAPTVNGKKPSHPWGPFPALLAPHKES